MGNPLSDSEAEGSQDNSIRPDIIDGFERKSVELLDYVNSLEAQLEQQKAIFEHKETRLKAEKKALEEEFAQRETKLKSEKKALEEKFHFAVEQANKTQKALAQEERRRLASDEVIRNLKHDVDTAQEVLQNERQRTKGLEDQIAGLKEQLDHKDQIYSYQKLKDEKEKARLEEETRVLRKKVTLGWILGCLTEVYLRLESEGDGGPSHEQIKGPRDDCALFKQTGKPAKLESIEREVRRLIECAESPRKPRKYKHAKQENLYKALGEEEILETGKDVSHGIGLDQIQDYSEQEPWIHSRSRTHKDRAGVRPRSLSPTPSLLQSRSRTSEASATCPRYLRHHHVDESETVRAQSRSGSGIRSKSQPRTPSQHQECTSPPAHSPAQSLTPRSGTPQNSNSQDQSKIPNVEVSEDSLSQAFNQAVKQWSLQGPTPLEKDSSKSEMQHHQTDIQKIIASMESGLSNLMDSEKKKAVRDSIIRAFFSSEGRDSL